ncbi:substrate-binding domain-containing protein [Limibaculum sp. M0105]|uniref:Substrate-binding domain-containing protein n=1 Tax=Thermohalobaculum xanthum TaxID=2753746 RepID=A0A8J7M9K8_9RHOB|nr:substrate-binding domain-containing protein [Thermohalobaculum xanthum]MBK0400866.1 substrate-binding domain-containing protein [Thermohalobaculum xanthum]
MAPHDGEPLRAFIPRAIDSFMPGLIPTMEQRLGTTIEATFELNPIIPQRVLAGEPFDLGITNPWYLPKLIDHGLVSPSGHRAFGRVALAIAGREPMVEGPETSPAGIIALLRRANSIAYTAEGTSGRTFLDAIARLGVGREIEARLVPMGIGQSPSRAAAEGKVDLAIAPLTTVAVAPSLNVLALFPSDLGADIDMSVFLAAHRHEGSLASKALDFLTDPGLDPLLRNYGLVRP